MLVLSEAREGSVLLGSTEALARVKTALPFLFISNNKSNNTLHMSKSFYQRKLKHFADINDLRCLAHP